MKKSDSLAEALPRTPGDPITGRRTPARTGSLSSERADRGPETVQLFLASKTER